MTKYKALEKLGEDEIGGAKHLELLENKEMLWRLRAEFLAYIQEMEVGRNALNNKFMPEENLVKSDATRTQGDINRLIIYFRILKTKE